MTPNPARTLVHPQAYGSMQEKDEDSNPLLEPVRNDQSGEKKIRIITPDDELNGVNGKKPTSPLLTEDKRTLSSSSSLSFGFNDNKSGSSDTEGSAGDRRKLLVRQTTSRRRLAKQESSFWEDAVQFKEGTIPQSIVIALVVGIVCGLAACLYYNILEFLLEYIWHTLPEKFVVDKWRESCYIVWIPLVGLLMAILVGLSVVFLGEPGDLAYTIQCVHDKAYISMNHVLPMVAASQFSIIGGGSLGPEAPLVAICAALGGFISRRIFRQRSRNVVRKHTLMGMAAALAAFFGCPLGGSLFALEVNSRFGIEYFEHTVEAIFCGEVCVAVFRAAAGLPIAAIWSFNESGIKLGDASALDVVIGALIGLCGAALAGLFAVFHFKVMDLFKRFDLLDNRKAVQRALLGSTVIVILGMLVPHTMFWGEYEFQTIWTLSPAKTLEHIFPTTSLTKFEMNSFFTCIITGFCKLIAISFTVSGGYRGGFIFPFFAAGAAFGRALVFLVPSIPPQIACLCFAAGINVAITRTSLATSIILAFLSGERNTISPVLAASLVSLFATSYMPFIKTQISRTDLDHSLYYEDEVHELVNEHDRKKTSEGENVNGGNENVFLKTTT